MKDSSGQRIHAQTYIVAYVRTAYMSWNISLIPTTDFIIKKLFVVYHRMVRAWQRRRRV